MVFSSKISITGLGVPSLAEIPINRWTQENVKQWLSEEGVDKKVIKIFKKKNVNGAILIDQNQGDLATLGVPQKYCEAIYHKIQQVKHRQVKAGVLLSPATGMTVVSKPTSSESNFSDRLTISGASTEIIITPSAPHHQDLYEENDENQAKTPPKRSAAISINNGGNRNNDNDQQQDNSYFKKSTFDEIHSFLQEQDRAREVEPITPEKKKVPTEMVFDETKFNREYLISDSDLKQLTFGKEQTVQEMDHEQKFILDLETGLLVLKAVKKERCKDIPLWTNEFSEKQTEMYDFCHKKLEFLIPRIGEEKVTTITQDLIFPERFRYKYLNPLKIQSAKRGSIFGEDPCTLKVKLVIAEISDGTVHARVRKFGGSHSEPSRQYGVYSSGLMFGPWYIAWDENSIATVRNAPPKAAISLDIITIKGKNNVGHLLGKLCSITSHYNYSKMFDFRSCNSQTFVESVISYLELKTQYEEAIPKGPVRNLLGVIRKKGLAGMNYSVEHDEKMLLVSTDCNTDLKMEVLSKTSLTFSSHSDLDEFVLCVNHANPEYFKTEPGLQNLQLLCLFDQSFSGSNVHNRDKPFSYKTPFGEEAKCPFRAFGFCKHQYETFQPKKGVDYDFYSLEWPQPVFKKK